MTELLPSNPNSELLSAHLFHNRQRRIERERPAAHLSRTYRLRNTNVNPATPITFLGSVFPLAVRMGTITYDFEIEFDQNVGFHSGSMLLNTATTPLIIQPFSFGGLTIVNGTTGNGTFAILTNLTVPPVQVGKVRRRITVTHLTTIGRTFVWVGGILAVKATAASGKFGDPSVWMGPLTHNFAAAGTGWRLPDRSINYYADQTPQIIQPNA